ncbi:MAG TPA: pseudouridine synthase [Candidatus Limnocylindria bacterium]|nr:pseudouridine synthase [Candidatus Limnocylindria bacterium]
MARERLQKLIARAGLASRRGAEELVADGRVRVNGALAHLGDMADPVVDAVEVDGRPLAGAEKAVHLAIHKPRGFVSSARDERGRRSVVGLVDVHAERLWPAGRLDVESEGLMLLTNDGAWANRVLHPRYGNEREYAALVDPAPGRATLERLRRGVELEDGPARLLAARRAPPPPEVRRDRSEAGAWLRVRLGEGRKREVRRIFAAVGCDVGRLVRTRFGSLTLGGLREGEWRHLRAREVAALAGKGRA